MLHSIRNSDKFSNFKLLANASRLARKEHFLETQHSNGHVVNTEKNKVLKFGGKTKDKYIGNLASFFHYTSFFITVHIYAAIYGSRFNQF